VVFLHTVRRDRFTALVIVVTLAGLCWVYLGKMIWDMRAMPMDGGAMSMASPAFGDVVWLFLMWFVMMAAMMLPSAMPMILAYTDFATAKDRRAAFRPIAAFFLGYVATWGAFSLAAAIGQWTLERATLVLPMAMALKHEAVAGGMLMAAGLYQWTPLKHVCLKKCRTPFGFLMTEWRDGTDGAFVMGWRHGVFCVGCCWALMALLFVAGVMNPFWIVLLTLFVILEKVAPYGDVIARVVGLGLVIAGTWLAVASDQLMFSM